ncbi:MAG: DUF5412 family protein [Sarcina sp.]
MTNKLGLKKDIYWEYHQKDAKIEWVSGDTVIINERELNVKKDLYKFNGD